MEQVGYDTYCKLLDEVVKEMQGIEIVKEEEDKKKQELDKTTNQMNATNTLEQVNVVND